MASSQTLSGNKFGNSNNVHQGDNIYNGCQVVQAENDLDNVYLRDLSQTDPRLDKMRILETKGPLLRESYSWILGHRDFKRWLDAQNGILWIKGDPGKGKTMLLCGVIESLEENNDTEDDIAYFFCQATDSRINTAAAILGGLTFGLARRKTSLLSYVREKHLSPGKSLFDNPNCWVAICDIFETAIQDSTLSRIVLIVDALDECVTTNRDSFLRLVVRTSSRVKWLLSSRNLEDIQRRLLSKDSVNPFSLELKENAEAVSRAVRSYIDHCVAHLEFIQESEELKTKVRDTLERKANDTFLWVALVLHQLQDAMEWEVLEILDQMPEGLQSLYHLMMNQIQNQPKKRRDLCTKLLSITATAYRPLHLGELSSLWQVEVESLMDQKHVRTIAQLCGSFLTVKDDTIYFIHQSAKDFVLQQGSEIGIANKHYYIFKSSIDVISKNLHRNIYCLKSPGIRIHEISTPCPDPLAKITYQCIFWIDHLLAASDEDRAKAIQHYSNLHIFFTKVYLYWLEAISLLRSMDHPVAAIYKLECLINQDALELKELIEDAIRFIQYNRGIIEIVPLQTYSSALAFAPECSIIRQEFVKNGCEDIPLILNRPNTWGSYVQTLVGHKDEIISLVFSPTSHLLVSSSRDGTARIWETKTGSCRHVLHIGENRSLVKFSPDSKQIASSDERKICLWSTDTGEMMLTLHSDGRMFRSIAFSSNSKLLASVYHDKTAWIWCTETGNLLQKLQCHDIRSHMSDFNALVAFSSDLGYVAAADGSATIWNIETSKQICSLLSEGGEIFNAIAFSPNSKLFASAHGSSRWSNSLDQCINVWSIATGSKLKTCHSKFDHVFLEKLAFTSNVELVIPTTQKLCHWQFQSSSNFDNMAVISSTKGLLHLEFSFDMAFFAGSEFFSKTISLWKSDFSGNSNGDFNETDISKSDILCVAISPDSSIVASSSLDTTVTLRRKDTGKSFQTLDGHSNPVTAIAFSPDSSIIVTSDRENILRLWRIATGECIDVLSLMELEIRMDYVEHLHKVAISADLNIIGCGQTFEIFILRKVCEEYKCVAKYSTSPVLFLRHITISANAVFVTWIAARRDCNSDQNEEILEHWRIDTNDSLEMSIGYQHHLISNQEENNGLMIPAYQELRNELDSSSFSWIINNNEGLLWIPKEFRPYNESQWDVLGSVIAVGSNSGTILIIDFSRQSNSITDQEKKNKHLKRKRRSSRT